MSTAPWVFIKRAKRQKPWSNIAIKLHYANTFYVNPLLLNPVIQAVINNNLMCI